MEFVATHRGPSWDDLAVAHRRVCLAASFSPAFETDNSELRDVLILKLGNFRRNKIFVVEGVIMGSDTKIRLNGRCSRRSGVDAEYQLIQ